jgi:hypothetical protein
MARRDQSCMDANGGHFQDMLWFRHISHTTNALLFKFRCNIFIGFRIIKEMPSLAGSGTLHNVCVCVCVKYDFSDTTMPGDNSTNLEAEISCAYIGPETEM